MNHSAHLHVSSRSHPWLKEAQFIAGVLVVIGGAAVALKELAALLAGLL